MGARKKHAPKRGSLAFSPRKRAKSLVPTIRTWPDVEIDKPILLGFGGYKAGMTGVLYVENDPHSLDYGKEVHTAATVIETPPLLAIGVVAYSVDPVGNRLRAFKTVLSDDLPNFIERRMYPLPKGGAKRSIEEVESKLDEIVKLRLLMSTQPSLAGIHKKKPEIFEVEIGGKVSVEDKLNYAREVLGKEVKVTEVLKPGDVIDVVAVTKGKGFQGPVKRWGIKILPPKSRKTKRKAGALGPWKPSAVMWTVPMAGQTGFHRRTLYHLKVLDVKTVEDGRAVTGIPFPHYGVLKNSYVIVKGSVPGPTKRFVILRHTVRPVKLVVSEPPRITYTQLGV